MVIPSWEDAVLGAVRRHVERNVMPEPYSGCHLWIGEYNHDGYGVMRICGSTIRAHRVLWEMRHGRIPHGLFVLHKCDTRLCVNPDHLYLGTQRENMRDAFKRNRFPDKKLKTFGRSIAAARVEKVSVQNEVMFLHKEDAL